MTKLLDILKNPVCFRLIFCLFIYFCIMYYKIAIIILVALSCSCAGNSGDEQHKSAFFDKKETTDDVQNEHFDLDKIQESGELIVASLYGPYDYFSFRGMEFGYQFEMAALYANSIGARIRVQVADTMPELKKMLENGEADMIISHSSGGKRDSLVWTVGKNAPLLRQSVNEWCAQAGTMPESKMLHRKYFEGLLFRPVHRGKPAAQMLNMKAGIISKYDALFKRYAGTIDWDWRLLASLAYQESSFNPSAVSWAGAQGLMQMMPATAASVGISEGDLMNPESSIAGATRYLRKLDRTFSDIHDRNERLNFVLASYNGGSHHIRDAMALAQKHGKNPHVWQGNVDQYVLLLSKPMYYNDASVKYGYMHGSETFNYVKQIRSRHNFYRMNAKRN